jgi:hypothetical protein
VETAGLALAVSFYPGTNGEALARSFVVFLDRVKSGR